MAGLITKIFGAGKKGEPPSPQQAIQKLRETEELLGKRAEFFEKKIEIELATARKNGLKNKRVSLMALKRKKRLEKQLNQIDGTLSTIEFQREALESASTNTEVLKNMSYAAKALRAAHQQLDLDEIHDIMDDISEQNEIADEFSRAISTPFSLAAEFDEDELLAEIEDMEQKELETDLVEVGEPSNVLGDSLIDEFPSVPTTAPRQRQKPVEEEDDLKGLMAWAS